MKTRTFKLNAFDVGALRAQAEQTLGRCIIEYGDKGESFRFMIEEAKSDLEYWMQVYNEMKD